MFRTEKGTQVSTVPLSVVSPQPQWIGHQRLLLMPMRTAWVEARAEIRVLYQRVSRSKEMENENVEIAAPRACEEGQ